MKFTVMPRYQMRKHALLKLLKREQSGLRNLLLVQKVRAAGGRV